MDHDDVSTRALGRLCLAAAGAALLLVASAPPTLGQLDAGPSVRLVVTALDSVVGAGTPAGSPDATMRVAIDNLGTGPVADVRIVLEVYGRARSRGLLRAALDRDVFTSGAIFVADQLVRNGEELAAGDIAALSIPIPGSAGWAGASGVYPVAVSAVRGTEVLDRVVTAVVHLADEPSTALDTAVILPLDDIPWRLTRNEYPPSVDAAVVAGGRLDRLVRGIEQVPDAPIVLAPSAHLLEDLVDRADGFVEVGGDEDLRRQPESEAATRANSMLQRIRAAAERRAVAPIATPYASVDLAVLAGSPGVVSDVASDAAATGADRLGVLLGRDPDPGATLLTDAVGDAGLALVSSPAVVVSWAAVEGPDLSLDADLASPVRRVSTVAGRRVTLLVADPYIERMLAAPDTDAGTLVAAQRVIAESAMIHFEAPGLTERPLVILAPRDVDLPGDLTARLLRGLVQAPWLRLTGPEAVREGADIDGGELTAVDDQQGLPDDLRESIESTAALIDGLDHTLVRDGTETVEPATLRDDIARASSTWLRSDLAARRRGVARVRAAADEALGTIEVAAAAGITLTAEQGTIPITLRRPAGAALDVRVAVDARGRLGWPNGNRSEEIRLSPDTPQTVSFTTVARSRGTFPVIVRVTDSSGEHVLHEATVSVRSTAISGPAVAVLAGIVLILVLIGLFRRRPRNRGLEVVQDLAVPETPDEH